MLISVEYKCRCFSEIKLCSTLYNNFIMYVEKNNTLLLMLYSGWCMKLCQDAYVIFITAESSISTTPIHVHVHLDIYMYMYLQCTCNCMQIFTEEDHCAKPHLSSLTLAPSWSLLEHVHVFGIRGGAWAWALYHINKCFFLTFLGKSSMKPQPDWREKWRL